MKKLLFAIILFSTIYAQAQRSFDILWDRTYGSKGGDVASAFIQTEDGGFIIAGYTNSMGAGSSDIWLTKLNANGDKDWEKIVGGKKYEQVKAIIRTDDNGFLIIGETNSKTKKGKLNVFAIKIDQFGNRIFEKKYGTKKPDFVSSVIQNEIGFLVVGNSLAVGAKNYDWWIFQLDSKGNMVWEKNYPKPGEDYTVAVVKAEDGGYAVAGSTKLENGYGIRFMLVNEDGTPRLDTVLAKDATSSSLVATPDGGYVVAGNTELDNGNIMMYATRLDKYGKVLWKNTYGKNDVNYTNTLINCAEGGYAVVGFTKTLGITPDKNNYDYYIVKIDKLGRKIWEKVFYTGVFNDKATDLLNPKMGEYYVLGTVQQDSTKYDDLYLMKFREYPWDMEACLAPRFDSIAFKAKPIEDFEPSKKYLKRLKEYEKLKANMVNDCDNAYNQMILDSIVNSYVKFSTTVNELSYYNADESAFKILLDDWYTVKMTPEEAIKFKEHWQSVEVRGIQRLKKDLSVTELVNMMIIDKTDSLQEKFFEVGKQINPKKDFSYKYYAAKIKSDSVASETSNTTFTKDAGVSTAGTGFTKPEAPEDYNYNWLIEEQKLPKYGDAQQCIREKIEPYKDDVRPKQEFETTKLYNARIYSFYKRRDAAVLDCGATPLIEGDSSNVNSTNADPGIDNTNTEENVGNSGAGTDELFSMVTLKIKELQTYNADREELNVLLDNDTWYKIEQISEDDAITIGNQMNDLEVKGIKKLSIPQEYINLTILVGMNEYKFGTQVDENSDIDLQEFLKKNK